MHQQLFATISVNMVKLLLSGFIIALASQSSFVGTVPLPDSGRANSEAKGDDNVTELENLKHSLGRTISLMRTQTGLYSDINGKKEAHTADEEEVKQNGQLVAKLFRQMDTDPDAPPDKGSRGGMSTSGARIRTKVDIPGENVHKNLVQDLSVGDFGNNEITHNGQRKSSGPENQVQADGNSMDRPNTLTGNQQYTPLDMAEYVFWTGDEKGASYAIEEFLREGMMTREEAILFLQEIKYNLEYLKSHYSDYASKSKNQYSSNEQKQQQQQKQLEDYRKSESVREKTVGEQIRSELNQLRLLQEAFKKRSGEREGTASYLSEFNQGKTSVPLGKDSTNREYEELLERLRLADFLYTEYSLEEVIYQLAKVMFTQALTGGGAEAQQALSKFMNFLEKEAEQGHISRSLQKKVLDVLIAALSDTINEHPELFNIRSPVQPKPKENVVVGQQFLKQILELPQEDKTILQMALNPISFDFQEQQQQDVRDNNQLKSFSPAKIKKFGGQLPFALGK